MLQYSININWSNEDGGYIATIPEFKNLSAFGVTYEEALKEAEVVVEGYIEELNEKNLPIPYPNVLSTYSGQTRLRMPLDLHQRLAEEAQRQEVSLNSYMVYLLSMNYAIDKVLSTPKEQHLHIEKRYYVQSDTENYDENGRKASKKRFRIDDELETLLKIPQENEGEF